MLAQRIVRKQMDVMVGFGRETLAGLSVDELLWKPSAASWSVARGSGSWVADWVEPEPSGLPPPSLAWQLWHCAWWLSMLLDHTFGTGTLTRERFRWEGPDRGFAVIEDPHERLWARLDELGEQDWVSSERTRWPYQDGRPFGMVVGWASMELTKNVAEMARGRAYHAVRAETRD